MYTFTHCQAGFWNNVNTKINVLNDEGTRLLMIKHKVLFLYLINTMYKQSYFK